MRAPISASTKALWVQWKMDVFPLWVQLVFLCVCCISLEMFGHFLSSCVSILFVLECKFSLFNLLKATVVQTTVMIPLLFFLQISVLSSWKFFGIVFDVWS